MSKQELPNQYLADKISGKVTEFFESEVRNKNLIFTPSSHAVEEEQVITFENLQLVETKEDELVKVTKPAKKKTSAKKKRA